MRKSRIIPWMPAFTLLMAASLACQAGSVTRFFVSPTPSPSNTSLPSATFTLIPTMSPTPRPTLRPTTTIKPILGVESRDQADGTTLFVDLDNYYQILFPKYWEPLVLSQKNEMVESPGASAEYPWLKEYIEDLLTSDADAIRMFSLNTQFKYLNGDFPTFLMIFTETDALVVGAPMAMVTAWVEDNLLDEDTNLSWDVRTNSSGVEVGINDGTRRLEEENNYTDIRERVLSFQTADHLIMIEITSPENLADSLVPGMESILDSIQVDAQP